MKLYYGDRPVQKVMKDGVVIWEGGGGGGGGLDLTRSLYFDGDFSEIAQKGWTHVVLQNNGLRVSDGHLVSAGMVNDDHGYIRIPISDITKVAVRHYIQPEEWGSTGIGLYTDPSTEVLGLYTGISASGYGPGYITSTTNGSVHLWNYDQIPTGYHKTIIEYIEGVWILSLYSDNDTLIASNQYTGPLDTIRVYRIQGYRHENYQKIDYVEVYT